jgi:hypothetical protein
MAKNSQDPGLFYQTERLPFLPFSTNTANELRFNGSTLPFHQAIRQSKLYGVGSYKHNSIMKTAFEIACEALPAARKQAEHCAHWPTAAGEPLGRPLRFPNSLSLKRCPTDPQ